LASGVALGAVLCILFAPEKGTTTRKKIKNKSKKLADDVKHKYENIKGDLKEKAQSLANSGN
jgi:gas vesicle protein